MHTLRPFIILVSLIGLSCAHHASPTRRFGSSNQLATAIAWSSDGSLLASADASGAVHVWQVSTGNELAQTSAYQRKGMEDFTTGIAFSPDWNILAFGTTAGTIRLWKWREDHSVYLAGQTAPVVDITFSPDGKRLVACSGGLTYSHHPTTEPTRTIPSKRNAKPIVEKTTITTFNLSTRQILSRVTVDGFIRIIVSKDGTIFAGPRLIQTHNLAAMATLQIRDTATGNLIRSLPKAEIRMQFSPDGKLLLAVPNVWSVDSGNLVRSIGPDAVTFAHAGRKVITFHRGYGVWWDISFDAETPWVQLAYTTIANGRTHKLALYTGSSVAQGFGQALSDPQAYSPDQCWAVDRHLQLWRVPR